MKQLFLAITLIILIHNFANSQTAPVIEWQKCLGGSGTDIANSIWPTSDGGYIVTGATQSFNGDVTGNHDPVGSPKNEGWIAKLNNVGVLQWQRACGGSSLDALGAIQQTADGGYIATGGSQSNNGDLTSNQGQADVWVVKFSSTGNVTWQRSLGGSNIDQASSIIQTTDGGYIIAAITKSNDGDVTGNHGLDDSWIIKLTAGGNIEWNRVLGGSNSDVINAIEQTVDGGYILAGNTSSTDGDITSIHGLADAWVLKLAANGSTEWKKTFGGSDLDVAYGITQTNDGGYAMFGTTFSNDGDVAGNHGGGDVWIVKLNSNSNIEWQKTLGGSAQDLASCLQQTIDNGYIISGATFSNDGDVTGQHGAADAWLVKVDSNGNLQWQKSLGGSAQDFANSMKLTPDGGVILAGYTASNNGDVSGNHGGGDYWVVKMGPIFTQCAVNINLGQDSSLCEGQQLSLNAVTTNASYLWQDHSTNPNYTVIAPGTYWVTIFKPDCISTDSINISYNPFPDVKLGDDITLCLGEKINLQASVSNATYLWQDHSSSPDYTVTQSGSYWVNVTAKGCTSSDTIIVNTKNCNCSIVIPNAFTPNADGIHDKWVLSNTNCFQQINVAVYNRYGSIVYKKDNYQNDWGGTYKSKMLPDGTYYYVVTAIAIYKPGTFFKGDLTILR